jgi:hypothetical protein
VAPDEAFPTVRKRLAGFQDLHALWRKCGLREVVIGTFEIDMAFASFDDYWQPILGRSTPTSAFAAKVDEQTGGALVRVLREKISGMAPDGSFILPARAFAVRGLVSSKPLTANGQRRKP